MFSIGKINGILKILKDYELLGIPNYEFIVIGVFKIQCLLLLDSEAVFEGFRVGFINWTEEKDKKTKQQSNKSTKQVEL